MFRKFRARIREGTDQGMQEEHQWLNFFYLYRKLTSEGIASVLREVRTARRKIPQDGDLETLGLALQLSQGALRADPTQLPAQLLGRIRPTSPRLTSLLDQCHKADDVFLLPNSTMMTEAGGQMVSNIRTHQSNVSDLTMTSDGNTLVSCDEDGVVVVTTDLPLALESTQWTTKEGSANDVRLCCDETVVVVSCDNSIEGFELKTGRSLWWQETDSHPSVCGAGPGRSIVVVFQGKDILLYDARSGDKTATLTLPDHTEYAFAWLQDCPPVGNERYAVSTCNGLMSLTVVDVIERRIVATKMLHDATDDNHRRHQANPSRHGSDEDDEDDDDDDCDDYSETLYFRVRWLALSGDGRHVIWVNNYDSRLNFLDVLTLRMDKIFIGLKFKFTWRRSTRIGVFRVTPDGRYLYHRNFASGGFIVWDLHTASSVTIFEAEYVQNLYTVDMRTVISTASTSPHIHVWDLSRPENDVTQSPDQTSCPVTPHAHLSFQERVIVRVDDQGRETVERDGELADSSDDDVDDEHDDYDDDDDDDEDDDDPMRGDDEIVDFIQLGNERYVLLWTCGILHHYLQLYDVIQGTVVRKGYIDKDLETLELSMTHVTGSLVACVVDRRLLMMDVDKMEVTMVFEGQTHDRHYGSPPVLLDGGKNLLVFSESGEHLKAYSVETGKEVYTIQQDTEEPLKMERFMVNHSGTFALAEASHGCSRFTLVAFDLRHRTFGGVVRGAEVGQQYLNLNDWRVAITGQGRILFLAPSTDGPDQTQSIQVYDLKKQMVTRELTDPEATDITVADGERDLASFHLVDDTTVIAGYSDHQIRVFDIDTGSVLHRLPGHQTCTRFFSAPDSGLLVSADWESNTAEFRVWRKRDFTRVTTLHTESPVRIVKLLLVDGGKGFILSCGDHGEHANLTQFTLQGRDKVRLLGLQTVLNSTPVLYSGYNGCVKVADFTLQDEDCDNGKG